MIEVDIEAPAQLALTYREVSALKAPDRTVRRRGAKQVAQIAASIRQFGFLVPLIINNENQVVVGAGRFEAAKSLGIKSVPTILAVHLTKTQQRAYAIADNRLGELSKWDDPALKLELQELSVIELDFPLEITGFEGDQLDTLVNIIEPGVEEDDQVPAAEKEAVTRTHDVWLLGEHRLVCGDAKDPGAYAAVMREGELARAVITDLPYNLAIDGFVATRGKSKRREFAMASGEMSKADFTAFLTETLALAAAHAVDGSIHYTFMDWRHLGELQAAGEAVYSELKNLLVWVKDNAGLGPFYRSQHELVLVWKKGMAAHLNTFGLGGKGRYRTNVLNYPGASGFNAHRSDALAMHPTVKPVAMIADLIRDVTHRGDIVFDGFAGSGTLAIAAAKTGRLARLIEIDPLYCDVICRRWAAFSGTPATLESTGRSFGEVADARITNTNANAEKEPAHV